MDEFENSEYISTGSGNPELSSVCSKLFYETGYAPYHDLACRVGESEQEFDKNFPQEEEMTLG